MTRSTARQIVRVNGLSLLKPTASRPHWRIKGILPNGLTIDTSGGKTRVGAEAKARDAVEQAKEAASPQRNRTTLYKDLIDEFLRPENHDRWGKNGGNRNAEDATVTFRNHIRPTLGKRTCESLRPSDFRGVLNQMRQEGYAGGTIQRVGALMRASVTFMMNEQYIPQSYDPMIGVTYSSRSMQSDWVPLEHRPTVEQKDALADAMAILGGQRWWLATQLAGLAGPRWGELIYLTPAHVSLETCEINVEYQWNEHSKKQADGVTAIGRPCGPFVKARPKNGRQRIITYPAWMNEHFERLFEQVEEEHSTVFPWSGRSRNPLSLLFCTETGTIPRRSTWSRQAITPAREAAAWPYVVAPAVRLVKGKKTFTESKQYLWSWHGLRHLFCSLAISKENGGYGLEPVEAARLAGHTLEVFLQKYVQPPAGFTKRTATQMAKQQAPLQGSTMTTSV